MGKPALYSFYFHFAGCIKYLQWGKEGCPAIFVKKKKAKKGKKGPT